MDLTKADRGVNELFLPRGAPQARISRVTLHRLLFSNQAEGEMLDISDVIPQKENSDSKIDINCALRTIYQKKFRNTTHNRRNLESGSAWIAPSTLPHLMRLRLS